VILRHRGSLKLELHLDLLDLILRGIERITHSLLQLQYVFLQLFYLIAIFLLAILLRSFKQLQEVILHDMQVLMVLSRRFRELLFRLPKSLSTLSVLLTESLLVPH
jgi:hypothetical protein